MLEMGVQVGIAPGYTIKSKSRTLLSSDHLGECGYAAGHRTQLDLPQRKRASSQAVMISLAPPTPWCIVGCPQQYTVWDSASKRQSRDGWERRSTFEDVRTSL